MKKIDLDTRIDEFGLPSRAVKKLPLECGIRTVRDLAKMEKLDLLIVRGLGVITIEGCAEMLTSYGLRFGMTDDELAAYEGKGAPAGGTKEEEKMETGHEAPRGETEAPSMTVTLVCSARGEARAFILSKALDMAAGTFGKNVIVLTYSGTTDDTVDTLAKMYTRDTAPVQEESMKAMFYAEYVGSRIRVIRGDVSADETGVALRFFIRKHLPAAVFIDTARHLPTAESMALMREAAAVSHEIRVPVYITGEMDGAIMSTMELTEENIVGGNAVTEYADKIIGLYDLGRSHFHDSDRLVTVPGLMYVKPMRGINAAPVTVRWSEKSMYVEMTF